MAKQLLFELGRRKMTNVLVEGGSKVLGSIFDARLVDEVWTFIAPKWVGSTEGYPPLAGEGVKHLAQAGKLSHVSIEQLDMDALIRGYCTYPKPVEP